MSGASEISERVTRLERRVERERRARTQAEGLLEEKSRALYEANQLLSQLASELEHRVEERTRELAEARERALELADRDQLTGLANRACFTRVLDERIARTRGPGSEEDGNGDGDGFALLLLDLDRFKEINDTLGHEAGDAFLRHVAARLRAVCCGADLVARLGGDEFALIVRTGPRGRDLQPDLPQPDPRRTAEALIAAVGMPVSYRDRILEASVSVGLALFPDDAGTGSELQRYADIALYRSKVTRATCTRYDAQMGRDLEARQSLGSELSQALRADQLEAWFQPVVDGASGRTTGVEALVRWRHPERGLLAPTLFLELAEERGLMRALFARMMRSACPPAKAWIEAGAVDWLSINVSPSQFRHGSVADDVMALLSELDFPPHALVVEITEEVLMNDLDRARGQLERLAARGVRIALDDFGVGYSNIGYLRQLPFHKLKLDRSISADVAREPRVRSILSAIVELARALDLRLVAEGIEEPEQALCLTRIGCRYLQGYLFGRPMPAEAFERRVLAGAELTQVA